MSKTESLSEWTPGTSKICVAVGETHTDGSVMILGVGQSVSAGRAQGRDCGFRRGARCDSRRGKRGREQFGRGDSGFSSAPRD